MCGSSITGSVYAHVSVLHPSVLSMTITRVLCLSHALIVPVSLYQAWFYEHIDNPYPEIVDITELCVRTGMTMVSRFANVSPLVIHDITLIFSGSSHSLVQFSTSEIGTHAEDFLKGTIVHDSF